MLDFKPPKLNTTLIQVAKAIMPLVNRLFLKGLTLDVDSESIARLKMIDGHPTVLAPNHAARADPAVTFLLSKQVSQQYYYMTARETFDKGKFGGLRSFLLQRFGAYSIVRGTADRNAFRTTRELLSEGSWPLVVFAEGEISRQNDTVMRFERGIIQLCFWALDDMTKAEIDKPLYIVPIGIKYHYPQDMWDDIDIALTELEENILSPADRTPIERYERLRRIGIAIFKTLAAEYQYKVDETVPLDVHIQKLKEQILSHAEQIMGIHSEADVLTRVRTLKNLVDAEVYRDIEQMTEYERKIHEELLQKFQRFYPDLERLINFIAISDGYVAEERSPERFLEVIVRLEREVFGTSKIRGPRVASIRVGEPKNLRECYDTYKADKRETVEQITLELETTVQALVKGVS
ncbi:MAG: 1-acyl-sn-glycerol-3-phosphate acyltransferase [Candidatus Poribacteria bacterium]|nr:1-acyl-sn-glycerol-3-phosphate acyltransferase [Candidatus Poribacteria bacterium]